MAESRQPGGVAIVGAGLAGSVVAAQLALHAPPELRIVLFDPDPAGPGTAYAGGVPGHLMNGPVRAMSAVPGDESHLHRWLAGEPESAFIPRARFGAYLADLVARALARHANLRYVRREVTDLVPDGAGFVLRDDAGEAWNASSVVLALGNPLPRGTAVPDALRADPRYVADPWRFTGAGVAGDVLCIGTGLTALDVLVTLAERGFAGRVHGVSRHALVPLLDDPRARGLDPAILALDASTPLALLRTMRRAARAFAAHGGDWRCVVDAIRKDSPAIWAAWSPRDRQRFLRHLQSYWSVHRYRVPPEVGRVQRDMEARGAFVRHRGTVRAVRVDDDALRVTIERAGRRSELAVQHVVNCTGPESDYLRIERPLVQSLLRRGLIRPDALRLGIDATPALRVVGAHGAPWPNLFTLGPPLRGLWYETTGVPEIRAQAAQLARTLLAATR